MKLCIQRIGLVQYSFFQSPFGNEEQRSHEHFYVRYRVYHLLHLPGLSHLEHLQWESD